MKNKQTTLLLEPGPSRLGRVKNPQFLSNQAGIQAILPTHELFILTKCYNDRAKVVFFYPAFSRKKFNEPFSSYTI